MKNWMAILLLSMVVFVTFSTAVAFANDEAVWAALKQGGKVILLRHTHIDMAADRLVALGLGTIVVALVEYIDGCSILNFMFWAQDILTLRPAAAVAPVAKTTKRAVKIIYSTSFPADVRAVHILTEAYPAFAK